MTTTQAEAATKGADGPGDREQRSRLPATVASHRILVDAGTLLASSLDYEATIRRIAALTVPALADLCLLHLYTPGSGGAPDAGQGNGEIRRVVQTFQQDLALTESSKPLRLSELGPQDPVAIALRSGETTWLPDLDDRAVIPAAVDDHLAVLRAAGAQSLVCVPLIARERVIGTLLVGARRRYETADVEIVEQVAQRAAWALDNALVHESAERARQRSDEAHAASEVNNRLKDNFLATLSHELRTPMAALLLWERILRTAKDDSTRIRALDAIHESAMAQSKLIEDLLDVSRCVSGKLMIESRVVSIPSVLNGAIEAALPLASAKGIRLVNSCHRALGCVIGDASRLRQVMGNLLSNALKFTERGGLVQVHGERVGTHVEVSVVDTGCGIAPEFLSEVWKPFHQAPSQLPRTQVGLGLGLAIVRQLVEMHDGTVRAESAGLGQGATFVVALPTLGARPPAAVSVTPERRYRRAATPPDADTPDLTLTPAPAPTRAPARTSTPTPTLRAAAGRARREARPLRGLRILVVDDEPAVLEALALVLRAEGSHVSTTRSALQALAALRRGRWDVVVSDIGMPGADGYSLMRRLRMLNADGGRRLPAIALTAHAHPQDEMRAIEAGFDVHLPKPVEAHDLVHTIASIVDRR